MVAVAAAREGFESLLQPVAAVEAPVLLPKMCAQRSLVARLDLARHHAELRRRAGRTKPLLDQLRSQLCKDHGTQDGFAEQLIFALGRHLALAELSPLYAGGIEK